MESACSSTATTAILVLFILLSISFKTYAMSLNSDSAAASASSTSAATSVAKQTIDFLQLARGLKTTPRTGWVRQEAGPKIESVADHSWRMGVMAMVASTSTALSEEEQVDANKCIRMALVHDLAESAVGDITPYCGISDEEKHARELRAMENMTKLLGGIGGIADSSEDMGKEMLGLWKEYEEGTSNEAKLVKDLDKLEMIIQGLEYELDGQNKKSLDGFFDSTRDKWRTSLGRLWGKEIERRRPPKEPKEEEEPSPKKPKVDG